MSPDAAFDFLLRFLDSSPDDDALCAAALTIGEPLVDWHWATIGSRLEELLERSSAARKLVSCCDFDERVPDAVRQRLYALVGSDDDIGHS